MSISSASPWLKFYGDTPAHLQYPQKTIYEMIRDTANENPKLYAYEFMGKKTTYAEFLQRIDRTARALIALGIEPGDKVTICMPNCPQAVDTFYALNRIGAISNMIHPLSAAEEIKFYLNFSHSKAVLILNQFYPKFSEIRGKLEQDTLPIVASIKDELPPALAIGFQLTSGRNIPKLPKGETYVTWNQFLAGGRKCRALPPHSGKYTDCASILYSGGTTGTTKGILLSNLNFNALGLQTIAASGFAPITGMKMLSVMPVFHGFGLGIGIHTALIGGAQCILVPQFNVKTYAQLLVKKQPNIIPGVPTLFEALLRADNLEGADLSFLKGVFCGGDSLSIELKKKVDAFLKAHKASVQIRQGYGLTECVTASCLTPLDYHRVGSIGVPFPDTYYKIVKPNEEEELMPGEEGEICISGPSVMIGYLDNPEETASTLRRHSDGRIWLHTGDLGKMDEDGFVYFSQRIKRMIVTSGYNVYPGQLENVIDGHEKVLLSCVIGVKDPYKIQKIKAYVVLKPDYEPSEEIKQELLDYCRKHIAKYAMPYDIEFRKELPKTLVGKVAYRVLEEEANAQEEPAPVG
ncbi:MAG: AMP-binding protein [Oscillospiraceae bacterium]|nr:AMP-binding protein [Oscillospiraceae bacterium]